MFALGLFPLLTLGAIGYAAYRLAVRTRPGAAGRQDVDLREQVARLFRLGLLFAAVVLTAEGIAGLIGEALPRQDELARDPATLARALSFTIVGAPALAGLAHWTRRRLANDPVEATEVLWAGYLAAMLTLSLVVSVNHVFRLLEWAVGLEPFDGSATGRAILWTAVLGVHWTLNRRRPLVDVYGVPEPRTPWYLLIGSVIGLALGSTGTWQLIRGSIRALYDAAFAESLISAPNDTLLRSAISAVLGIGVWSLFWLRHGQSCPRTERWFGYVLLIGVLGGLIGLLSSAGVMLHAALQWFFGDPSASSAAVHFDLTPGTVSAALLAFAVWAHHRRLLGTARAHRNETDRIYTYLVSFIGLSICAAAGALVVSAFIDALVGGDIADRAAANPIVLAVTFLLVGLPVWLVFWRRAERNAAGDLAELRSPSRRVYLFSLLGISATVALVSLVTFLTILLEDVTSGDFSDGTVRELRIPLGLVLSAVAVAGYHVAVHRDDRRANPPPPPPVRHVREVVLISDLSPEATSVVCRELGGRVVPFVTTTTGPAPDIHAVEAAVAGLDALAAARALVTIRGGSIEVQALRD